MFARVETCAPAPITRHSASEASRAALKCATSRGISGGVAAKVAAKDRRIDAAYGDQGAIAG